MPFSAATGRAEAASATELPASHQMQPASRQIPADVPKRMLGRGGLIFDSRLETAKDMKLVSPFAPPHSRETPVESNQFR
jgi:hypothetical protein